MFIKLLPPSKQLAYVTRQPGVETAARPPMIRSVKPYRWFRFTGKKVPLKLKGAVYSLNTGDYFGVSEKDASKMVILKHGLDKVFKITDTQIQDLCNRNHSAATADEVVDLYASETRAVYRKVWLPLRDEICSKQLVLDDGAYMKVRNGIGQYARWMREGGKGKDTLEGNVKKIAAILRASLVDIDLETQEDNEIATRFMANIKAYSDGAAYTLYDDMIVLVEAGRVVKAIAAKETKTARSTIAQKFGKSHLSDLVIPEIHEVIARYESGEPIVEETSDGGVEIRPQAAPAAVDDTNPRNTNSVSLRGQPSKAFRAAIAEIPVYFAGWKGSKTKIAPAEFENFVATMEFRGMQFTPTDKARLSAEYQRYSVAFDGIAGTIAGNIQKNKAVSKADKIQVSVDHAEQLLNGNVSLSTMKKLMKAKITQQRPNSTEADTGAEATQGRPGRPPLDMTQYLERVEAGLNGMLPWDANLKKYALELRKQKFQPSMAVKAIIAKFSPAKQSVATPGSMTDTNTDIRTVKTVASEDTNKPGRPRRTFEEYVKTVHSLSGYAGFSTRSKEWMALLRECYDNKVSVKNAWREIQQRQGVDPDTVTPEITTPDVAEEMQVEKRRGGRPRATVDAFMQKVEDKSGVEIDQDPAFRSIVEQVYNAGGSVKDAVESVMGSSMFEKQEEAKIVPPVPTTRRKPGRPKAEFKGPNLTDDMIGVPSVSDDDFLSSLGISGGDTPSPAPKTRKPRTVAEPVSNDLEIDQDVDPFADDSVAEPEVDVFAPAPAPAPAPKVTRKPRPAPSGVESLVSSYTDDWLTYDPQGNTEYQDIFDSITRIAESLPSASASRNLKSITDTIKSLHEEDPDGTDILDFLDDYAQVILSKVATPGRGGRPIAPPRKPHPAPIAPPPVEVDPDTADYGDDFLGNEPLEEPEPAPVAPPRSRVEKITSWTRSVPPNREALRIAKEIQDITRTSFPERDELSDLVMALDSIATDVEQLSGGGNPKAVVSENDVISDIRKFETLDTKLNRLKLSSDDKIILTHIRDAYYEVKRLLPKRTPANAPVAQAPVAPKSGMSARDRAKMLTKNAFDPTDISPDAYDFDGF